MTGALSLGSVFGEPLFVLCVPGGGGIPMEEKCVIAGRPLLRVGEKELQITG